MSKQMESSRFILSPFTRFAELYQRLLSGIISYEELGTRILKHIKAACAFRQVELVRELASILINIPINEYQVIGRYYLVWCQFRECMCNDRVLEGIIEQTESYKSKALISRAAFEIYRGKPEPALYFYTESLRANPTPSDYIVASRGIATAKSMEGFHASALKDLDRLIPILRHAEPLAYYDVLNSYAVELIENNRVADAHDPSLIAASSRFAPFYPEWRETHAEVRAKGKRGSIVSISLPKDQPEAQASEPVSNVVQFPTGERIADLHALVESSELSGLSITPLQLLALILRIVLKERITDAEIEKICSVYYDTVMKWYPLDLTDL